MCGGSLHCLHCSWLHTVHMLSIWMTSYASIGCVIHTYECIQNELCMRNNTRRGSSRRGAWCKCPSQVQTVFTLFLRACGKGLCQSRSDVHAFWLK